MANLTEIRHALSSKTYTRLRGLLSDLDESLRERLAWLEGAG